MNPLLLLAWILTPSLPQAEAPVDKAPQLICDSFDLSMGTLPKPRLSEAVARINAKIAALSTDGLIRRAAAPTLTELGIAGVVCVTVSVVDGKQP